jgi:hypothetical protein
MVVAQLLSYFVIWTLFVLQSSLADIFIRQYENKIGTVLRVFKKYFYLKA